MKKIFIVLFIFSIIIGFFVYKSFFINNSNEPKTAEISKVNKAADILETNSLTIKSTPNTFLIFKKSFMDCEHIITEKIKISENLVNKTENEFINLFSDWQIENFSEEEIILNKTFYDFCNEHYLLKDDNGLIAVYSLDINNNEILQEVTNISTEYLTETDKMNLKKGIQIFGNTTLYSALEDFE